MADLTLVETTPPGPRRWTPPDQPARDRIHADLHTSLLVEAGAGSGKTTAMVDRMIQLIRTGTATVDQIAAVTFTRKAAGELRERFQERLEEEYRAEVVAGRRSPAIGSGTTEDRRPRTEDARGREAEAVLARLSAALDGIGRCFVGTIHSFCGRLLRERPLEAGVPPAFEEVSGPDEDRLRAECWGRFLERLAAGESRLARRLASLGLRPAQLRGLFREVSDNPDVRWVAPCVGRPSTEEIRPVRAALEALLSRSADLLPEDQPEGGWDALQKKVRKLKFSRFHPGWDSDARFLDALSTALASGNKVTQKGWGSDRETKAAAKALAEAWDDFCAEEGPARRLLDRWLAHRYPQALRLARAAAGAYAAERRRAGKLVFQDLLVLTARLLREDPGARRDLGRRYRYLLVDEFQDTDPIQAEVVFLLASEPEGGAHWSAARPRPGALFVVGDPKQSIYRFRRADISVYSQVKRRFREVGDVLGLTANFRSTRPVERFVNETFRGPLPDEETPYQAAFAPLAVKPGAREREGVRWYGFEPAGGRGRFTGARVAAPESELLASWIAERVARGERRAGDFMVLTRTRHQLSTYARALEARNVPVQVSGAGVGAERELEELVLLLKALCDPGDPVLTLAVLEGLFYGLSHEDLHAHVRLGGGFHFLRGDPPEESPAAGPLRRLREFWTWARDAPADVAVPRIVEHLGIVPHAAAAELGSLRAGALLYVMDVVRAAGAQGTTSLPETVEVLETTLEGEAEAPLFPGETDAVRLMNLHKAKGLEAPVVVLAYPAAASEHGVWTHVTRDAEGRAVGHARVRDATRREDVVIACPPGWAEREAEEALYRAAEEVRLLYVATTRARDELVVGRCPRTEDTSHWRALHPALDDPSLASELGLEPRAPAPRARVTEDAASLSERIEALRRRRDALARPSFEAASVTRRAKGDARPAFAAPGTASSDGLSRGVEWGRVVHRSMELVAKGVTGHALESACRGILVDEERPTDDHGHPTELPTLVELLETLRRSPLWRRAREAARLLAEVPFLVAFSPAEAKLLGVVDPDAPEPAAPQVVEGVIDLAFLEPGGQWVIADYKTDRFASAEARRARTAVYRRQVDLYATCWERLTGGRVGERVLLFTGDQSEVRWSGPSMEVAPEAG